MLHQVIVQKLIRSPMLYPAELRAHQCFQQLSRKPRSPGPDQVRENTAKILRQPRLSELNGRSYPKKTAPSQVSGCPKPGMPPSVEPDQGVTQLPNENSQP